MSHKIKPVKTPLGLEFGDYCVPLDEVLEYNDTHIITLKGTIFQVWRLKDDVIPKWYCDSISLDWD